MSPKRTPRLKLRVNGRLTVSASVLAHPVHNQRGDGIRIGAVRLLRKVERGEHELHRVRRGPRACSHLLTVNVTSPVWAQELSFLEKQILERIGRAPGAARVTAIRFRVGPLPDILPLDEVTGPTGDIEFVAPPRDPVLEAALTRIEGDELRAMVARAAKTSLSRPR